MNLSTCSVVGMSLGETPARVTACGEAVSVYRRVVAASSSLKSLFTIEPQAAPYCRETCTVAPCNHLTRNPPVKQSPAPVVSLTGEESDDEERERCHYVPSTSYAG